MTRKLNPKDVETIKERRAAGEKVWDIATDFGISSGRVSQIAGKKRQPKEVVVTPEVIQQEQANA